MAHGRRGSCALGSDGGKCRKRVSPISILKIDRVVRFLYNRLLNISPPFQQGVSVESDNDPLNVSYEDILRTAQFAGHLESHSSEVAEARSFLYPVDDAGIPRKSDALVLYEDYENRISTLELETALAHNGMIHSWHLQWRVN